MYEENSVYLGELSDLLLARVGAGQREMKVFGSEGSERGVSDLRGEQSVARSVVAPTILLLRH